MQRAHAERMSQPAPTPVRLSTHQTRAHWFIFVEQPGIPSRHHCNTGPDSNQHVCMLTINSPTNKVLALGQFMEHYSIIIRPILPSSGKDLSIWTRATKPFPRWNIGSKMHAWCNWTKWNNTFNSVSGILFYTCTFHCNNKHIFSFLS